MNDLKIEEILELLKNTEKAYERVQYFTLLGCRYERLNNFELALEYYMKGIELIPELRNTDDESEKHLILYYLYNNSGYCFIRLKHFEEAEAHCRKAISIDPHIHNAYKNLGLSLMELGNHLEAAMAFISATKVNPQDTRAFMHLQELLASHPDILKQEPKLQKEIQECHSLIAAVGDFYDKEGTA